jgi:hypothetical protein
MIGMSNLKTISNPLKIMAGKGIRADYSKVIAEIDSYLKESNEAFFKTMELERSRGIQIYEQLILTPKAIHNKMKMNKPPSYIAFPTFIEWFIIKLKANVLADELYYLRAVKKTLNAIKLDNVSEMEALEISDEKKFRTAFYGCISRSLIISPSMNYTSYKEFNKDLISLRNKLEALNTAKSPVNTK